MHAGAACNDGRQATYRQGQMQCSTLCAGSWKRRHPKGLRRRFCIQPSGAQGCRNQAGCNRRRHRQARFTGNQKAQQQRPAAAAFSCSTTPALMLSHTGECQSAPDTACANKSREPVRQGKSSDRSQRGCLPATPVPPLTQPLTLHCTQIFSHTRLMTSHSAAPTGRGVTRLTAPTSKPRRLKA